jgi:hypothetical protein
MIKMSASALSLMLMICASQNVNAQIFSQDLTMHVTTTSPGMAGRGGGSFNSTEYFSKNAMKTTSSEGNDVIIRFDSEKIITIDNRKKTYTEMTFKQLQDMINNAGAQMGQNREAMEQMRKMMGQGNAPVTLKKEGPGENIAGYPTEKYLISGPMEMELWKAPSLKIPTAYYDVMKMEMPANPMFDMKAFYDEMKKIDGMTLKSVMTIKMMNMEMKTTRVVNSIEKGAIPASVFEVPAGYKLVQK